MAIDSKEIGIGPALPSDERRLTWAHFFEDVVGLHGERVAIRFEGEDFSFLYLQEEVQKLAKALVAKGAVKGTRVAVHMANRPEFAIASFAIAMVGGVMVPLNTFATPAEREHILRHSDASILLFQKSLLKHNFLDDLLTLLPELNSSEPQALHCTKLPFLRHVVALGLEEPQGRIEPWEDFIEGGNTLSDDLISAMRDQVFPSDDSVIIYTSGTTSLPKGVLHMHRAAVLEAWGFAENMRFTPKDRVWSSFPFFWSAGICMTLGACFAAGAMLVLQETFEPGQALQCLSNENINATQCWPHQAKAMLEHPSYQKFDLSRIDKEVNRLNPDIPEEEDLWGTQGAYGMTETFTLCTNLPADSPAAIRQKTVGKPLPGMMIRIADKETGAPLPLGEEGEIVVKGATLMRGYYKVTPEHYLDRDGYFHSQDGGYFDEKGYLYWTGRLSNMIKTGGANVSPLEIEEALQSFPNMRIGYPFGAPHPVLGEAIVLCAVAMDNHDLNVEEIQNFLKEKLAAYKRPKKILLFHESDLSFTGNQKIKTDKLIEKALKRLKEEAIEIEGVNYGDFLVDTP